MKEVFVKDEEGYVCKKPESKVTENETIITESEYNELSGFNYYVNKYGNK